MNFYIFRLETFLRFFTALPFFLQKIRNSRGIIVLTILFACLSLPVSAQVTEDLSNVKVEELTDDQVRKFIIESDRLSLRDEQIDQLLIVQGMNPDELAKLKDRIRSLRKSLGLASSAATSYNRGTLNPMDSMGITGNSQRNQYTDLNGVLSELKVKNFGFDVFNNSKITFEPNLRLPTPLNYRLAADDELLIDVSGNSEMSYKLRVTPEGLIRIPVAGPVYVNGLTIADARKAISRKLSNTIYSNIKTGRTVVDVNLGAIRSIKVTVIGEATVTGNYTLPSLATVYNALYACGGPNLNGSFRNIQLIRNGKVISTIDVYKYLLSGSRGNDMRLMDDDVIKINTYNVRIELKGEVKKPGFYDVLPGETLAQLISYAGGYTSNAYTARLRVFRNTSVDRQVSTVTEGQTETMVPQGGDTYIVGKILNRFTNRINIKGAIYRPGEYELREGMTLLQLIKEADGLREDAFTNRGNLHRLKDDLSPELISFDIQKLMNGEMDDILLRREDRVVIFSKFDLKEGYYVSIEGEVIAPGSFLYEDSITVEDLVLMAGGLKESATLKRVEISRRIKDVNADSSVTKTAIIFQQDINLSLRDSSNFPKLTLMPFDEVSIRAAPGYFVQKNVVVEGEVLYTGKYTLESKNDRISDLVKRAGGLSPEAYLKGAVLVRTKNLTPSERNNNEQGLANLLKQNYEAGLSPVLLQNQLDLAYRKSSDNVGIDLETILNNPKSKFDLLLQEGDTLRIPKQLQTVRVNGEVLYPALVRYNENFKFKDYIIEAGGFSDRSARKKPYVVYANGSVKGTKSFLFFRNYPRLSEGAEIFVPIKRERERLRTGELLTIGATLVTMLAIIYNIFGS